MSASGQNQVSLDSAPLPPAGGKRTPPPGQTRTPPAHGRQPYVATWANAYPSRPRAATVRTTPGAPRHLPPAGGNRTSPPGQTRTPPARGRQTYAATWANAYPSRPWASTVRKPPGTPRHFPPVGGKWQGNGTLSGPPGGSRRGAGLVKPGPSQHDAQPMRPLSLTEARGALKTGSSRLSAWVNPPGYGWPLPSGPSKGVTELLPDRPSSPRPGWPPVQTRADPRS